MKLHCQWGSRILILIKSASEAIVFPFNFLSSFVSSYVPKPALDIGTIAFREGD